MFLLSSLSAGRSVRDLEDEESNTLKDSHLLPPFHCCFPLSAFACWSEHIDMSPPTESCPVKIRGGDAGV